jgi:histidine ammonia-lyase
MSTTAARRAAQVVNLAATVVDIELLCAAHALQWRLEESPELRLGKGTGAAFGVLSRFSQLSDVPSEALDRVRAHRSEIRAAAEGALASDGEVSR